LLHLPTEELIDARPNYFGLASSEVEFDPDAPEPKHWLEFLDSIFGNDRQAIAALQCWFGYCLTTDTSQQKVLLIIGPKRSGKGTLARILTALVGRDNVAAPTLAALSSNFGLETLIGRQVAIISDARLGGRTDQAAIAERLLSISGEDAQQIDRKFRIAWVGRLTTKFMILSNELPRVTDASNALTSRFIVITMERSFYGKEDPGLTAKLMTELPGIMNWAPSGYAYLRQRGHFQQPDSARETIEALETLSSPITAFIRERCRLDPAAHIPVVELYAAWRDWCAGNGRREPGTPQTFGRDLSAAFPAIRKVRPREGESRFRAYQGVDLS
jgi:putative DNA primase/helicase